MKTTDLKTAAAYIRVSTDSQTELSPDSQIKTIQQFAKQHGFIVPKEFIFRDDGISGRRADKRPEFIKMIATAKKKPAPFSAILLWKFSRFARNQEESIFYKAQLRRNGIEVLSVSEPIMDGPFGSLIERIIEWTDEYYSIRLSGEVKRGMTEKVERGQAVSIPSFGYNIQDKKYVINPDTAPIVKNIFADYLNGVPTKRIAIKLNELGIKTTRGNLWENRTVEYILHNPVYIGKIRWNPKRRTRRNYDDPDIMIIDGEHEPIIDEETFAEVQKRAEEVRKRYQPYIHQKVKQDYMLHGLVKCSNCGLTMSMVYKGQGLQCIGYTHGKCNESHYISVQKINKMVIAAVEVAFKTESFSLTVKRPHNDEQQIDIASLIKREKTKLGRIREAYEDGVYTLEEYKESKEKIEKAISRYREAEQPKEKDINELKHRLVEKHKDVLAQLKSPEVSEKDKNELLKEFIEKIVFNRPKGAVQLFFYA